MLRPGIVNTNNCRDARVYLRSYDYGHACHKHIPPPTARVVACGRCCRLFFLSVTFVLSEVKPPKVLKARLKRNKCRKKRDGYRIRRCLPHPPGAVFQARLLDNQEGAATQRQVFAKLSVRFFQRRSFWHPHYSCLLYTSPSPRD